jgi:hypothetical protein
LTKKLCLHFFEQNIGRPDARIHVLQSLSQVANGHAQEIQIVARVRDGKIPRRIFGDLEFTPGFFGGFFFSHVTAFKK